MLELTEEEFSSQRKILNSPLLKFIYEYLRNNAHHVSTLVPVPSMKISC